MENFEKNISIVRRENIILAWLGWHFYQMPKFLFGVWKNYISFGLYYFSIPLLLSTLFSPWRKYHWRYPKAFDAGIYFNTFISNMFSRLMGLLSRILLIAMGIVVQLFIVVAGFVIIVAWIFLPLIIALLIWLPLQPL